MIYLQDPDVTLHHGDVLATLRELPAESVDCVVTSPPYWGLRDYGTGQWEGGDAECDHKQTVARHDGGRVNVDGFHGSAAADSDKGAMNYRDTCGKCGATRIDQQLGLEATPELFVERMVEVFREVRRVLAAHGTVWLNLGDSYGSGTMGRNDAESLGEYDRQVGHAVGAVDERVARRAMNRGQSRPRLASLKPKDLVGIPWRVAFALQADGWYLRSDIIWAKPNPMPESVTDRPTKAHEYVFLLSKQPRYFFDQEAVREKASPNTHSRGSGIGVKNAGTPFGEGIKHNEDYARAINGHVTARNIRSVWDIATQPYPEAHFATFPEELARRCIAAGCPEQVCRVCGKARERIVDVTYTPHGDPAKHNAEPNASSGDPGGGMAGDGGTGLYGGPQGMKHGRATKNVTSLGFTDCGHADYRPGIVLDPFMGSGTVAHVARKLGRHAVGIDLSAEYLELAAKRLQQQSLFAEAT